MENKLIDIKNFKKDIRNLIYNLLEKNKKLLILGKIFEYQNNCNILVGIDKINNIFNKNIK